MYVKIINWLFIKLIYRFIKFINKPIKLILQKLLQQKIEIKFRKKDILKDKM